MRLDIFIENLQSINRLEHSIDLDGTSLICITGKNGSRKTTLMKTVRTLVSADTFIKTSSSRSFSANSKIRYRIDEREITFQYDVSKKSMESNSHVPLAIRKRISVELPIPHGERFVFFEKISENDASIRTQVILKKYRKPQELIDFLQSVYKTTRFENLVELQVKGVPFYVIPAEDNYYLREDHFSSGEYFLISIYRRVILKNLAIFIDEIDISLDAAAQVRLVGWLTKFKNSYNTTFVFTTHSLPMMKMVPPASLFYMEAQDDGCTTIQNKSYAYIKSTLFGFKGWDRYILTEDQVLKDFLEHFISKRCKPSFYQLKIIFVGGGSNTTDLMERNKIEHIFTENPNAVITILDGDQRKRRNGKIENVFFIPMESVEKELLTRCLAAEFWNQKEFKDLIDDHARLSNFLSGEKTTNYQRIKAALYKIVLFFWRTPSLRRAHRVAKGEPAKEKDFKMAGKRLFKHLIKHKKYSQNDIFDFLIKKNQKESDSLRSTIENFTTGPDANWAVDRLVPVMSDE
jgi:ABC-type dipeptide/oligopeptide/nickel transport system ATPase subunit